jgi:hypothetical protein
MAPIPAAAVAPVAAPLPAWTVGTSGEFDWQMVRALTEKDARLLWASDFTGDDACEDGGPPKDDCECDLCSKFRCAEVNRVEQWDSLDEVKPADWLRVGFGHVCSRCGYETFREEGGKAVGDEAVCEECMTVEDWDAVDPERAAELRAEMADEA